MFVFPSNKRETLNVSNKVETLKRKYKQSDTASTGYMLPTDTQVLEGFVDSQNDTQMRQLYRDLYYHDAICGTCVDIYSLLPFGDFSLSGVPNKEMLNKFLGTCDALRLKSLFPAITIDQMVDGAVTGALSFDASKGIFNGYLPLNLDYVDVKPHPMHGRSALLDIQLPEESRRLFNDLSDPRVKKLYDSLPKVLQELFTSGQKVKLEPEVSVYIPRPSRMSYKMHGVSLFRRVVPIWLLEKTLLRGTIEQAHRRQRGITVVTVGDIDWPATKEEMNTIGENIILADRDPLGAVLVTRPGVNFQDIKNPTDSWRHSDIVDVYSTLKFRAMGFSESMMSGDMNVGNADSIMSTFNHQVRAHRDNMVRSFLYEQVFPYTSMANDFRKEDKYLETSSDRQADYASYMRDGGMFTYDNRHIARSSSIPNSGGDPSAYYCPTVNFYDTLKPEVQTDWLDRLDKLEAKGVPIPLRTFVAATGLSVGDLVASMDEDVELRKVMHKHARNLKKYMPAPTMENMASLLDVAASAGAERRSPLDRKDEFESISDVYAYKANGNRLPTLRGRKLIEEKANKVIAEARVNMSQRENHEIRKQGVNGRPLLPARKE